MIACCAGKSWGGRTILANDEVQITDLLDIDAAYRILTQDAGLAGRFAVRATDIFFIPDPAALKELEDAAMNRAIETIRLRIDESGTKDLSIRRQGATQIAIQLPGVDDPAVIKSRLGKTAKMTFHLVNDKIGYTANPNLRVPASSRLLPSAENTGQDVYLAVFRRPMVDGETLIDASAQQFEGRWVVSFRFNSEGGRKFGQATSQNVGKPFAIVLDNTIISAPRINEPILGGSGIISGSFTIEEARELALLLRSGALPVPLDVVEERTVGAGLGADSIAAGKVAFTIGIIAVLVFMIVLYGSFGALASLALIINGVLLVASITVLGADLTMPGIAGIVLTMGMAVDANILIFERMREEAASGKPLVNTLKDGFDRAYTTIIDANITTLLAGVILYFLGTGPIKGFAVTLSLGIITTLFTTVLVSKLLKMWVGGNG